MSPTPPRLPKAPLLDRISGPEDFRDFSVEELVRLTEEVRQTMIHSVSYTGGHLAAGLGVAELTVALHDVFDTPRDKLIWDVGHQA
jgi:1-deoxy-D-xylulose-5-phosphate synthase